MQQQQCSANNGNVSIIRAVLRCAALLRTLCGWGVTLHEDASGGGVAAVSVADRALPVPVVPRHVSAQHRQAVFT